MDRRKAIKSILALGAVAVLPFPDVFSQESNQAYNSKKRIDKNLHIVGLGGGGSNMLGYYHMQGLQAEYTCISDEQLNTNSEIRFINYNYPKWDYSVDDWSDYNLTLPAEVKSLFETNEHFVILIGLGGFIGTLLGKSIFHYLNSRNNDFVFICSYPFVEEGKKRKVHAESAFKEFKEFSQFKSFRLSNAIKEYRNLKLTEGFRKADEYSYKVFMNTL